MHGFWSQLSSGQKLTISILLKLGGIVVAGFMVFGGVLAIGIAMCESPSGFAPCAEGDPSGIIEGLTSGLLLFMGAAVVAVLPFTRRWKPLAAAAAVGISIALVLTVLPLWL